ncbi:sporulation protein YpjB [Geomicrobium sp. JSM 1781026]|uniref:sporulation protein YpjB n=1 Tax=Geomicrobium sp. JSM 1781026 TaxID=3344580 RepID=UPI0035C00229
MRAFIRVVIPFILVFVVLHGAKIAGAAERQDEWVNIDTKAEEIVLLVEEEKYEDARLVLRSLSTPLTRADYESASLNIHDMGIIIRNYERTDEALTAANMPHEERLMAAERFYYLIDAVIHPHQPAWLDTREDVFAQLEAVQRASNESDPTRFQHAWNEWVVQFQVVRPAMMLRTSQSEQEEIRSLLSFMSEHSHRLYDESEAEPFFKALTYELNRMYDMEPKSSSSSLLMVIFIVGGFIVTSLTYAGWKKYKGEKERERG